MRPSHVSLLFVGLLALASALSAAEGGFLATLSEQQQAEAGLTRLSAEQQITLNRLVAREVSLARQGGVTAFAGTFFSRRKPEERAASGLDQLTTAERDALNLAVSYAIAAKPVPLTTVRRMRDKEFAANRRLETHGSVTFLYGRGSGGRDLFGGSVYTEVFDRQTGVTVGVGVSQFEGDLGWGWPVDSFGGWPVDPFDRGFGPFLPLAEFDSPWRRDRWLGGPICGPRR